MPGPRNSKKTKKQRAKNDKAQKVMVEVKRNVSHRPSGENISGAVAATSLLDCKEVRKDDAEKVLDDSPRHANQTVGNTSCFQSPSPAHEVSFIVDPGNGPRVNSMEKFLSSFFCPPISMNDEDCSMFARKEILIVLEAILPKEVALIVWYNRTRLYDRICPACRRLYRVRDDLIDPVTGDLIDVNNPKTPPNVVRERRLSGLCSFTCYFLASYSSHPYTLEIASGAWGLLSDELDAQVRSLLDATDPRTAAILRYGLAACTPSQTEDQENSDDQGLGRVLRLTRRKDLGLGEVLEALAWYEKEKEKEATVSTGNDSERTSRHTSQGE